MMPCILLALPNQALPYMAVAPDAGKLTARRHPQNSPGRDQPDIWLRNAAAGLCVLAAAAAVVSSSRAPIRSPPDGVGRAEMPPTWRISSSCRGCTIARSASSAPSLP